MASTETIFKQFLKKINHLELVDDKGQSGFSREFLLLRQTSLENRGTKSYSTEAGQCPVNRAKNRFKDILPFDSTRVKLPSTGAEGSDYINANFIKGANNNRVYIASQGPLPNTVNDFWRMLWSFKVKVIVMVCREVEMGKQKCKRYWPENNEEKVNFGGIQVKTAKCVGVGSDFTLRTLVAEFQGEELQITQFHYTDWPDHGVPPTTEPLIHLIKLVREYQPEDDPPIVVHCSAGCGRTGTICALDYTQTLLKQGRIKEIDPFRTVENLRKQRPAMVQTKGQYEFLCRAMCSLFREKLNLPIEEEMESHLYENVTVACSNEDSDSDNSLSPSLAIVADPLDHKTTDKKEKFPQSAPVKERDGRQKSPVSEPAVSSDQKRLNQITQQSSDSGYINVSFDLIDLSDDTSAENSPKTRSNANTARASKSHFTSPLLPEKVSKRRSSRFPEKRDTVDGGHPDARPEKPSSGFPVVRQDSDEYVVMPNRSRSPVEPFETSEYIIPSRGQSSMLATTRSPDKTKNTPPVNSKNQTYENVIGVQAPSPSQTTSFPSVTTRTPSPVSSNGQKYENVEVPTFKSASVGKKPPVVLIRKASQEKKLDKAASPTVSSKPKNPKAFVRCQSSSEVEKPPSTAIKEKFSSCGPNLGARYLDQVKGLEGLNRAKVLPSEDTGDKDHRADGKLEQQFFSDKDVGSGLYASVGTRNKASSRNRDNPFRSGDIVDGSRHSDVPTKNSEHPTRHDILNVSNEMNSKSTSLSKKFPFLSKKSEAKGLPLEHIGYGKRLPKPKGPRSPPKSWGVTN